MDSNHLAFDSVSFYGSSSPIHFVTQVGFEPTTATRQNSLGNCDGHPLRFTEPFIKYTKNNVC